MQLGQLSPKERKSSENLEQHIFDTTVRVEQGRPQFTEAKLRPLNLMYDIFKRALPSFTVGKPNMTT